MRTLALTKTNGSWGAVQVEPPGPNEPEYQDADGTFVTLTPEPIQGKSFKWWTIWDDPNRYPDANYAVIDDNSVLHLTMDKYYAVQASFKCGSGIDTVLPLAGVGMVVWLVRRRRR